MQTEEIQRLADQNYNLSKMPGHWSRVIDSACETASHFEDETSVLWDEIYVQVKTYLEA